MFFQNDRDSPVLPVQEMPRLHQAPISAIVLTRNSERLLPCVLLALNWCEEIVVLDTGSSDRTAEIAARFANVSFQRLAGPFPGFGLVRRHAVSLARNDWILSIDSDEVVSLQLAHEVSRLRLEPGTVYSLPFRNFYRNRQVRSCGWWPDRHVRLFHRGQTNFTPSAVHERIDARTLRVQALAHPVDHYSYSGARDFLRKMDLYAALFAEQHCGRRRSGPVTAVGHAAWTFFKSYVLERGLTEGTTGLVISAYKAQTAFWKYILLHEANRPAES
jgi:glycosyltransferase involved in cell wall biosynthesis